MKYKQYSFLVTISLLLRFLAVLRGSYGASLVKYLPGFQGPLPFELETGYIGVDEGENVQLFYYFVKSSGPNPEKDPLVLLLTGGPGCSVLTRFLYELGPIKFVGVTYDGSFPTLTLNPHSWTEVANILFLDLPVGTGFSYAKTPADSLSTGLQSCKQTYQFLQKWLVDRPEFIPNPFYLSGDSYCGMTIPVIAQLISNGNEMGIKPRINLKGYLLGNPQTFPDENNYKIPFAHGMALIPDELYKSLKRNCRGNYINVDPNNSLCYQNVLTFHQLVDNLEQAQILEPTCDPYSGEGRSLKEKHLKLYNDKKPAAPKCRGEGKKLVAIWANDPSVQEALHIKKGSISKWTRCNLSLPFTDTLWDSRPYHANLSTKGYRSLIYNGDHDMRKTYVSSLAWIRSLNFPIVDEWRQWIVQEQVAGFTRTYANNMTFATVKGGGHTAPEYKPMECAAMFKRWISYQPL